jgi:LuxR family transcriptional regulator, activator of conjugal transfer of Ti plasmids
MKSNHLNSLIDAVPLAADEAGLMRMLRTSARKWGYDHFVYLLLAGRNSFALSSYPEPWQRRYFQKTYQLIDPIVRMAKMEACLFSWSADTLHKAASRDQANFLDEATGFGISSGVSIPVAAGFGRTAVLSFASALRNVEVDTSDPIRASTAATLLHAQITFIRAAPTMSAMPKLSPRQALCLRWSSEGKTMDEIAEILEITTQSVRFHLDEARAKLDAVNLIQASSMASRNHLI